MGASRFLHGISSYLLMFLIGAEFLQVYNFFSFSFFLSFLPPFFSSLSPYLPAFSPLSPSLPAFSPLPFTAADLSSGTQKNRAVVPRWAARLPLCHTQQHKQHSVVLTHLGTRWGCIKRSWAKRLCDGPFANQLKLSSNLLLLFQLFGDLFHLGCAGVQVTAGCYGIRGGLLLFFFFLSSEVQAERKLENFLQTIFGPSVFLKAKWTREVVGSHSPL